MDAQKQVGKEHYRFDKYVGKNHRWVSYWHQIDEILKVPNTRSVLEVGPGAPMVRDALKFHAPRIEYKSLDIAEDLRPDIVGIVTDIPAGNDTFDVVCAFQILEHIPYEEFDKALGEIARVSKRHAIISLPHFGPSIKFQLKIPTLPMLQFAFKVPYPKQHEFNGEHYWEIGKKGYSVSHVREAIQSKFDILKEYIPYENQCHRFYILEKK